MSHEDNNAGLPKTQEFGGQKIFFQKFFLDYIFYMSLYVAGRFQKVLGISGNENIKTISFLRTETLYNYMFLLVFFVTLSLQSDLFSAYSHYSRCAVEMR